MTYAVKATLVGDNAAQGGKVDYPSLRCGGSWTLQKVTSDTATFLERIEYGSCIDKGTVALSRKTATSVAFLWIGQGITVDGTLTPSTP